MQCCLPQSAEGALLQGEVSKAGRVTDHAPTWPFSIVGVCLRLARIGTSQQSSFTDFGNPSRSIHSLAQKTAIAENLAL